jgi:hypothetical protein
VDIRLGTDLLEAAEVEVESHRLRRRERVQSVRQRRGICTLAVQMTETVALVWSKDQEVSVINGAAGPARVAMSNAR